MVKKSELDLVFKGEKSKVAQDANVKIIIANSTHKCNRESEDMKVNCFTLNKS